MNASNLTVATVPIMKEFKVSQTQARYIVCLNVLLFGCGNLFWVPLSRLIGMRPVYLVSLLLLIGTNCWSTQARSFNSLLASRIASGFAASAADAIVPAVAASLFLITDRGQYLMVFHLALTSGLFLGPLISGLLVQHQTWRWSCGFVSVAGGILLLVAIFGIRETTPYKLHGKAASNVWGRVVRSLVPAAEGYHGKYSVLQVLANTLSLAAYPQVIWVSFTIGVFVDGKHKNHFSLAAAASQFTR